MGPPYTYQNVNIDSLNKSYNLLIDVQNKNSLYLTEINNILKKNIPDFSNILSNIPNTPTYTPNAKNANNVNNTKNAKYDFMKSINKSTQDDDVNTLDISNEDTYELIIQQNTMYILGSLACASLLIASIFIGRRT